MSLYHTHFPFLVHTSSVAFLVNDVELERGRQKTSSSIYRRLFSDPMTEHKIGSECSISANAQVEHKVAINVRRRMAWQDKQDDVTCSKATSCRL